MHRVCALTLLYEKARRGLAALQGEILPMCHPVSDHPVSELLMLKERGREGSCHAEMALDPSPSCGPEFGPGPGLCSSTTAAVSCKPCSCTMSCRRCGSPLIMIVQAPDESEAFTFASGTCDICNAQYKEAGTLPCACTFMHFQCAHESCMTLQIDDLERSLTANHISLLGFCHNDLQYGNMLLHTTAHRSLSFNSLRSHSIERAVRGGSPPPQAGSLRGSSPPPRGGSPIFARSASPFDVEG